LCSICAQARAHRLRFVIGRVSIIRMYRLEERTQSYYYTTQGKIVQKTRCPVYAAASDMERRGIIRFANCLRTEKGCTQKAGYIDARVSSLCVTD